MTAADEIIDRLADRRAELGLSLRALAKQAGYGHSTIQHWEYGNRQPKLRALCDWCQALGVEIEIRG